MADSDPADETHETLVKAVPLLDAVGRSWTTPSAGTGRTTAADGELTTTVTATALPADPAPPWRLVPVRVPGGLGGHKWADRRILAGEPHPGLWSRSCDPLLVDADGTVLETGRANVFVVVDGSVRTPPADGRILPGIVRARVLKALRAGGCDVDERPVRLEEFGRATEVFVTNSVAGVHPVGSVDGVGRWEPGPVVDLTRELVRGAGASWPRPGKDGSRTGPDQPG